MASKPKAERRQDVVAPIGADTRATIEASMGAQGCTCGPRLRIVERPLTAAEEERWEGIGKKSGYDVGHAEDCPFLAGRGPGAN